MKLKRVLAGSLIFAAGSLFNAAFAQGYIGASIGQSELKEDCVGTITCDLKDTGFKLFGGYMFTPNFGAEAAYVDLGKARASVDVPPVVGVDFKSSGFALYGTAVAPIDNFSVFAKLGIASMKAEATALGVSISKTKSDFAWGVGAGYSFTKNLAARLEYERFRVELEGEKSDVDLLSLGVSYRF